MLSRIFSNVQKYINGILQSDFQDDKKLNEVAVNSQEKHESIKRIEDLLEANEFSFSFVPSSKRLFWSNNI